MVDGDAWKGGGSFTRPMVMPLTFSSCGAGESWAPSIKSKEKLVQESELAKKLGTSSYKLGQLEFSIKIFLLLAPRGVLHAKEKTLSASTALVVLFY